MRWLVDSWCIVLSIIFLSFAYFFYFKKNTKVSKILTIFALVACLIDPLVMLTELEIDTMQFITSIDGTTWLTGVILDSIPLLILAIILFIKCNERTSTIIKISLYLSLLLLIIFDVIPSIYGLYELLKLHSAYAYTEILTLLNYFGAWLIAHFVKVPNKKVKNKSAIQNRSASKISHDNKIEELKKIKELLDAGVITQEEFNAKKKQILGL